ncbi:equilibrative nucleoside transporter 2-like isoform X1 [Paralichthys olivaceus]|uniref:equilibrative nucleoside transporter 2-like isoform X1 n=1 Tax=Paralichthys olivaceus TaxID=8255 RepID=UPI003750DAAF
MWNEKKLSPPADRGQVVALIIFTLGVGTLLPWNFFITATQYFKERLTVPNVTSNGTSGGTTTDYNYDSWMALLSQLPLLLFTLLNSFLYQWVRERVRVVVSLVTIFFLFSLTAVLISVPLQPDAFFSITMATIWFINMCSAVLQCSLFGVVSLFPHRYSSLFMSGQCLSGVFAAVALLCSILSNADKSSAALGYFIAPCVATLGTLLCYLLLPHLDFARFYLNRNQCEAETSQELMDSTDKKVVSGEDLETNGKFLSETQESPERSSVFAVFKKVTTFSPECKINVSVTHKRQKDEGRTYVIVRLSCGTNVFSSLHWSVGPSCVSQIWSMALCITCVFTVTLSVFPVIAVRVQTVYKDNAAWDKVFTCICCFIVFNVMDLAGRAAPSLVQWPSKESFLFPVTVASRLVFIPVVMMCNINNSRLTVLFGHDCAFITIMALFSFSNGYLASLCMAYAPQLVHRKDCETTGSLMTFFLVLGLALGAAFSFLLGKLV